MAKGKKSVFFCQNCGHEENKWLGQCPMCKEWNTFVEEPVSFSKSASAKQIKDAEVVALKHVETDQEERIKTKIEELDRVLGGGIVPGSLLLVGGDPGIGKSTLLLQVCQRLCEDKHQVLYISGEESLKQIKLRANRMGEFTEDLLLLCETNLEIVEKCDPKKESRKLSLLTRSRRCTVRRWHLHRAVCHRFGNRPMYLCSWQRDLEYLVLL